MKGILLALGVLSTLVYRASANVDHVSLYASGGATITEASATLVLPSAPNPITGDVALWSAIQLDIDFIQGVTENAPSGSGYCTNLGTNWCNFAYALTPNAQNGQPWDQDLYVNDSLVSSISTSQGQKGNIFYISVECASGSCAAAPAHSWEDVSIVLSTANPNFKHSGSWYYGATGGEMSTSDGGKTWTFTTLNIPATTD
ncbi:hypothetical protein F5Y07DRAFT_390247 [Xylaria sp. FL0933]|nr:hypothetical protein F5Y07DRAFT_390247 [Xylaria sp. FL0933]